jgi:hypothetical protein
MPANPIESELGKPTSKKDIDALEKQLGRPLPASYRAYLACFGSEKKDSFNAPLGPADHQSKETKEALARKSSFFDEFEETNPIEDGAIPFILQPDTRKSVFFVPPMRKNGEMDVVDYDITEEQQRFKDLHAYFSGELDVLRDCIEHEHKAKRRRGIVTTRQAIDAILSKKKPSKTAFRSAMLRLGGQLPDGGIPVEATINELRDRDEAIALARALRKLRGVPNHLLISLAHAGVDLLRRSDARDKAIPFVELLDKTAPKKPCKPNDKKNEWWLGVMNSAIHNAFAVKNIALAVRLADIARPHVRGMSFIPHNAACAFAAAKRWDDALAMCRIAVEIGYEHLDKLRVDRDLGPLLKRREFKSLFA